MTVVYFDTETTGTDVAKHVIIQVAAVAVDDRWSERESFEAKLHFDIKAADPEALKINSFDPEVWKQTAVAPARGIGDFGMFLRRHASVPMVSKRGRPYSVARLAGHNVSGFDIPFLRAAFRALDLFFPATFIGLDTLQLAAWWCEHAVAPKHRPENLKLGTLASYFGIDSAGAHDALADVRMNVAVARQLISAAGFDPGVRS